MTHTFAAAWLSAALLAAFVAPATAETPADPAPAAAGPDAVKPQEGLQEGPQQTKPATTLLDRRRNDAAKLAGMVRFVNASCPGAKPDFDRFKRVVAGLGVDIKDLEGGELMVRSMNYAQAYQKEVTASCERALGMFGESGTVIPGLIARKAP